MHYALITKPLVVAYGAVSTDGSITFLSLAKEITFDLETNNIQSILRWCNGHRTTEEVRVLSQLNVDKFNDIFEVLIENGVVQDACSLGQSFHENSMYPLLATQDLSPEEISDMTDKLHLRPVTESRLKVLIPPQENGLLGVLKNRKSSRMFGSDSLTAEQFSSLLASMYGHFSTRRPVPSAGGLYQLRIYVLLTKKIGGLSPDCYEYLPNSHKLRPLKKQISFELANFLLDSEGIAANASAVICVAAELSAVTKKYSNRAYRLILLEAGHIAQNAYLYCSEQDLSVVEYGGFNDVELSRYLGLDFPNQPILTTLIVGSAPTESGQFVEAYTKSEWSLRHSLMLGEFGSAPVVKSLTFSTHHHRSYTMPRYVAHAEYFSADPDTPKLHEEFNTATGAGLSLQEAAVKAMGEAFERQVSGNVRADIICSRESLTYPVYDLCDPTPLHPDYVNRTGLHTRKNSDDRAWVFGTRLSDGRKIASPIDQVFYPVLEKDQGMGLTYFTTSTGVAVHPNLAKATEGALLELIERDAIAVTWYARRSPNLIPRSFWSQEIQNRVEKLSKSARRNIVFCDLTLDSVPVVMCMLSGQSYPYMTTGSSANWDHTSAMSKALDEAELMLHSFRSYPINKRSINPEDVKSVVDHARLWATSSWSSELTWLLSGDEKVPNVQIFQMQDLIKKFEPAVIDLQSEPNSNLSAVRVISPILMPITFGYGAEHYRHPRVKVLGYEWGWAYPALPHCLA